MGRNEHQSGIHVGAAGHRFDQLDSTKTREIEERIAVVFAALYEVADDPAHGNEPIEMVASLAEGADRFFASQAIEAGIPVHVILPAAAEVFRG